MKKTWKQNQKKFLSINVKNFLEEVPFYWQCQGSQGERNIVSK